MEPSIIQDQYTEILNKIKSRQNGPASEAMCRLGLKYELNYGVSIAKLKEISADYFPNTELANFLLQKEIRETKILAFMLFDFGNMSNEEIEEILKTIDNHELAEQISVNISEKTNVNKLDFKLILSSENDYQLTAAYILCSRYAQFYKNSDDSLFTNCLRNINIHIQHENIHLIKAISRALRTISLRNSFLKKTVFTLISELKKKNTKQTDMIFEEVIPLIKYEL